MVVVFTVRELLISLLICQLFIFLLESWCIVVSGGMCDAHRMWSNYITSDGLNYLYL